MGIWPKGHWPRGHWLKSHLRLRPVAIYIALLHYPVYDRQERVTATALTTLDIHDVARLARTYGLEEFYVVTPPLAIAANIGEAADRSLGDGKRGRIQPYQEGGPLPGEDGGQPGGGCNGD